MNATTGSAPSLALHSIFVWSNNQKVSHGQYFLVVIMEPVAFSVAADFRSLSTDG